MDIYTLLIIGHLVGTILGVGGATMIEVQLNRALADGSFNEDERALFGLNFVVLRTGLVMALATGFGFVAYYVLNDQGFRLQNPVLWAKLLFVVILAVNALLLQAHKVSIYWGSAFSFVTWWATFLLGVFLSNSVQVDMLYIFAAYIVSIVGGAFLLHKCRLYTQSKYS